MGYFRLERVCGLSVGEAWRRVTDWERHADHVPLTSIELSTSPPTRRGTVLVARTGIGAAAFDDPMEVVVWEPPAHGRPEGMCRLEKRGSLVTGWAEITVGPPGPRTAGGARVVWREHLGLRPLPRPFDRLTTLPARLLFGRVVDGLLRTP